MNLKRIELRGFKSFAERTGIDFLDGVTCIVGPNGCGKSNITDSIRWVLGEQKTGALRAKKMEDVIFNGTEHRDPLNYAEVNLIFDNAEGFFNQGLKEMSLKRILHRSGESNYYINGQVVRLKDVRELLMDSGIGISGYSLISQGDIEDILRDNKFNRRKIFEEASGISLFNHKKEEAQRRLLKVKDHLLRLQDIYGEIDGRLEPLKEAAAKAKTYLALRDELKAMEIHFGLMDYDRYKEELSSLEREIKRLRLDLDEVQRLRSERLEQKASLEENQGLREAERDALRETIRLQVEARDEVAVSLRVHEEKLHQAERRLKELETERNRQQEKIRARTSEGDALKELLALSETSNQEKLAELKALEAELAELRSELHLSGKSKEELADVIRDLRLEQERLKSSLDVMDEQQVERSEALTRLTREAKLLKIDRRKLEDDLAELADSSTEEQTRLQALEHALATLSQVHSESDDRIEALEASLRELDVSRRLSEEKIALLDSLEDTAQHAVSASLMERNIRLKGQLIEHLKIKKGYEKAIEASLGRAFYDQLLVDARQVPDVMDYLRGKDLPQMGFLVPSLIHEKRVTLPKESGVLGLASDFVTGGGEGFEAIQKLLQNTIVTKDLSHALALNVAATIVTLDGESIKPSGAVTSAKSTSRALNRLEEREKLSHLLEEMAAKDGELEELYERRDGEEIILSGKRDELTAKQTEHLERIDTIRRRRTEADQANAVILFQEKQLQESIQSLTNQVSEFDRRRITLHERMAELAAQEQQAMKQQQPIVESTKKAQYDELLDRQLDLRLALARLDEERSQVRSRTLEAAHRLDHEREALAELERQWEKITQERATIRQATDQLQDDLAKRKLDLLHQDEMAAHYQEQILGIRATIKDLDQLILNQDDASQGKRDSLSQKEILFTRSEERQHAISEDLWAKYDMSILQLRDFIAGKTIDKTRSFMKNLRLEMVALEPVHLGAIEEYAELTERHGFLGTQIADLRASEQDIQKTIRTLEARMKEDFRKTFDVIRENYHTIFTELFQGGHGDIVLDDPDDILESDITILASPPGKKLQHMNLLSGGEKALTAIALLFSVLRAKPAPFYVLDEIEAALDDINIQRFGHFLEEFSQGSQFILITHRKGTMEFAKALYGVSMEEKGVSKTVSLELRS